VTTVDNYQSQIATPVLNWLTNNPTKHPGYIVLFLEIPTRLQSYPTGYGSIPYNLQTAFPGIPPFVNNINANTLADCEAYVDKLASFGASYSPGKLIISASAGGYANTNYILDNVRTATGYPYFLDYTSDGYVVSNALGGLTASGVSSNAIIYNDGLDTITTVITNGGTNYIYYYAPQITNATNVAGYISWGAHSGLRGDYANGTVNWSGNSGWWIIETAESFNGIRGGYGQGNFTQWFSPNAFGGTNYSNTPIGAVCHVEEPHLWGIETSSIYFGLWAAGKNLAISAWNSRQTAYFQAVGDPFVVH
jgi:hypothetical protein